MSPAQTVSTNSYIVTDLQPGQEYTYQVWCTFRFDLLLYLVTNKLLVFYWINLQILTIILKSYLWEHTYTCLFQGQHVVHNYRVSQNKCIIRKQIPVVTEPKISYIILWEYFFHFVRHILVQVKKIPNIMKLILGSVILLIMGVCFFRISNHAVLLGRPVAEVQFL